VSVSFFGRTQDHTVCKVKLTGVQMQVANGHAAEALPCVHMCSQSSQQTELEQRLEMLMPTSEAATAGCPVTTGHRLKTSSA